jgi:hypothetical protein
MERFEKNREKKSKELEEVMGLLLSTANLKTHKGIVMQRSSCEYFRGVNFHLAVLQHGEAIMKMIPSFKEDKEIE